MSYLSVDKLQLEIYCSPDAIDWQAQPLRHDTARSSMSKVAVDPDLLLFFVRRQDENQWPRGVKRAEALNMQKEQSYARKIYPLVEPNSEANQGSCWANEPHHLLMVTRPRNPHNIRRHSFLPPRTHAPVTPQVTLLLMNSAANEALPIFLDRLVPSPVWRACPIPEDPT